MPSEDFTTAGTHTWTAPAGVTSATVSCWGGGAGGSYGNNGVEGGYGGYGGGFASKVMTVTPATSYDVIVGAGGNSGFIEGGDSYFDAGADVLAVGGGRFTTPQGTTLYAGGVGGYPDGSLQGGGGAGGAGSAGNGSDGELGSGTGYGGGGGGGGGGNGGAGGSSYAGQDGSAYGGGGGGGGGDGDSFAGGNGYSGRVLIEWTDPPGGGGTGNNLLLLGVG